MQSIEVDGAEHRGAEGLVAAREIAIRHQEHDAGEDAAASADDAAQDVPAWDLAALHITRPEDQVGPTGRQRLEQRRQEPHGVAEVGVYLDDDVGSARQHVAVGGHVGTAEPLLGLPMQDGDLWELAGQFVGQRTRSVRRAVVDDEDVRLRHSREDRPGDRTDVLTLVVCGNDDPDARAAVRSG